VSTWCLSINNIVHMRSYKCYHSIIWCFYTSDCTWDNFLQHWFSLVDVNSQQHPQPQLTKHPLADQYDSTQKTTIRVLTAMTISNLKCLMPQQNILFSYKTDPCTVGILEPYISCIHTLHILQYSSWQVGVLLCSILCVWCPMPAVVT
jgi:hypothetical protein